MAGMEALLESPGASEVKSPKIGSGFGDIRLPENEAESKPPSKQRESESVPNSFTTPPVAMQSPAETSLVQEAIDLFGGAIVRTEPIH